MSKEKIDYDRKYRASEKGKACTKRYNKSSVGIATRIRYQLTDRYLAKHLRFSYGLSIDDYYKLVDIQHGGCAICGQPNRNGSRLCVDHDHETGKVRGLLCTNCNALLGQVNDNILILKEAIKYLKSGGEDGQLRGYKPGGDNNGEREYRGIEVAPRFNDFARSASVSP